MTLSSYEIRKKFLDFFASKGHTIVASDSVVPKDDPTVLFTTAGMQQFKRQFLGYIGDYTRAASSQKCLRTDDLDKVGKTDFHHTFFEMLGNFSFGDYFKKEAIAWAWEFLTRELKIPAEKLWVSVYTDDDEAAQIWLKDVKIDPERIVRLGDKSNFWPAEAKEKGPNGPCGPCSEIFYDYGVNPKCANKKCDPDCNCGRFSEIWNLVFTQFNRQEGGVLEPLPNKNIDTGMGLERLVAVVQGKKSNYETDLFAPLIKNIKELFSSISETDARIIADHMRAIVFAIGDGVVPSNKGRGFVVKKLITTVSDIFLRHTDSQTYVHKFVSHVVVIMKDAYPNLRNKEMEIEGYVKKTEEDYKLVFITQIPELKKCIEEITQLNKSKEQKIKELGRLFFFFRDTHGLSNSTIYETALSPGISTGSLGVIKQLKEEDIIVESWNFYNDLMEEQKNKSRTGSKMTGDVFTSGEFDVDIPKTKFEGYEQTESTGKVLRLFIDDRSVNEVSKGDQVKVVLDKTPFYAEAGGQVGDTGYISGKGGKIRVEDTQKFNDVYVHRGVVEDGLLRVDEPVATKIDAERRAAIMRHHTATHLLQAALREVLGKHVQQQGSLVAEDRLRFDFAHPKAVSKEELKRIEDRVNENVTAKIPVQKEVLDIEEAKKKGALAFFAEKYGDKVRVVSIGNVSKEFCGGTHLNNTSEIGTFKIASEGAVAQGIRRLEAKTGKAAEDFIKEKEKLERASVELAKAKQLELEQEKARYQTIIKSLDPEIKTSPEIAGTKIFNKVINDVRVDTLKNISDFIKQTAKSSAVILGSQTNGTATIVVAVTDDLVKRGISAREIVKEIAPLIEGGGGGTPQMAQAGSKNGEKIAEAVQRAGKLIRERIGK
ncbi:MAG: alanine--tRNA ligase [Candidatus Omnitrophica bacterium]|nr:alanine--tRNA ligase [Candidatus Omnitrophota bacterium]